MSDTSVFSAVAPDGSAIGSPEVSDIVARACTADRYRDQRVLVVVPDGTRTAPVGLLFQTLFKQIGGLARQIDVIAALGTHQPMSEAQFRERLEISEAERTGTYGRVRFFNHEWNNPGALRQIGAIDSGEISRLTGGLFSMEVPVEINARIFDYDRVIIIGPVFPHEVVGFSGGNKYLFPGIGGPQILNFFHWLAAVITNPMIIGNQWTAVR